MTPLKTVLLAASALGIAASATADAAPLNGKAAEVLRPAAEGGEAAVKPLLREAGYGEGAVAALHETARHTSPVTGRTFVTYEQRVFGMPVHSSYVRAVVEADGELSQLVHRIADIKPALPPQAMMPNDAVLAAAVARPFGMASARVRTREGGRVTFERGTAYQVDPVAEAVYVADEDGTLAPATLVRSWSKADNRLVHALVDEKGAVLDEEDRTSNDSYVAYAVSPAYGSATVMSGSQADSKASPQGWLGSVTQFTNRIRGNNVEAYLDTNNDNVADGGGTKVTNGVFGAVANLGKEPEITRNKEAAVQNLFYHVNRIHDRLYKHGFTETAGNFQRDNYGRGGVGGDQVLAEVLDGSGVNNANMAVPTNDGTYYGTGPRMQMYEWTAGTPDRAGSFDADIIWHEYGHGVLWRMVGDLDWPISWAVNEGFADALAVVATGEDRVGEWATGRSTGIRSAPYGTTGKRLGSYKPGKTNAHSNGEIYGAAIWALREENRKAGRSDDQLLGLMIDALGQTKPRATFLDMRDGLLAAGGSADDCRVWRAFAKVGMGRYAAMSWSGSKGSPSVSLKESSAVPSSCGTTTSAPAPAPAPAPTSSGGTVVTGLALSASKLSTSQWSAQASVTVKNGGSALSGATMKGRWSTGEVDACVTNTSGVCKVSLSPQGKSAPDATFKVVKVNGVSAASSGVALSKTVANPFGGTSSAPAPTTDGAVLTDIGGAGVKTSTTRWKAKAFLTVMDGAKPSVGTAVKVQWSNGATGSCTVASTGLCKVVRDNLSKSGGNITVTVTKIGGAAPKADGVSLKAVIANPF